MSDAPGKLDSRLVASGLLTADALAKCRAAAGDVAGDERILELLVLTKHLTKWQVSQIQAGKYQGFFLDHYKLLEPLGRGGMGSVFRAEDTRRRQAVAVKVLTKKRGSSASLRRFRREAEATLRVRHEHLVRTVAFGQHDDRHYLVMELIEGTDLAKYIARQGRLSVDATARIGYETAQALECAARHGIVHRDVKPPNILLTRDGKAKLADLGLAKFFGDFGTDSHSLTESGALLGTVDYMSPEQAEDARCADVRSDIYSLGCTLYHCLTGQVPFPAETSVKKIMAHRELDPQPITDLNPDVPARFADLIVQRMLAKQPSHRFQTHGEVVSALKIWATGDPDEGSLSVLGDLIDDLAPDDVRVAPSSRPSRPSRSDSAMPVTRRWDGTGPSFHIPPAAIGLGALVLVLLGIVWVLRQEPSSPRPVVSPTAPVAGGGAVPKLNLPATTTAGSESAANDSEKTGGTPPDPTVFLGGGAGLQPGARPSEPPGPIGGPSPLPPPGAMARRDSNRSLRLRGEQPDPAAAAVKQAHDDALQFLNGPPQDLTGYRRVCSRLIGQIATTVETTDVAAELAWVCALAPNAIGDYSVPLRLASDAARLHENRPELTYYMNAHGAVLFRAGRLNEARSALYWAMRANGPGLLFLSRDPVRDGLTNAPRAGTPYDWILLAMVEHQMNLRNARDWFDATQRWIDRAGEPTPRSNVRLPLSPQNRSELKLLFREAASRLGVPLRSREIRL